MFQPGPDWNGPPMAVLINKADLVPPEELAALADWYREHCRAEAVFVGSALGRAASGGSDEGSSDGKGSSSSSSGGGKGKGAAAGLDSAPHTDANAVAGEADAGVAAVKAWAASKLPEGPTLYPKQMVSEQPERFFVAEIIREEIFHRYDQEVPYATQVQITEFKERPGAKDYVHAAILVERAGQRAIILGAAKELGAGARARIEEFLGRPVYLELSVQVAPNWRSAPDRLREFGYFDPLYVS
jgi:GTP-binding protein Era